MRGAVTSLSAQLSQGFGIGDATVKSDLNKSRARGTGEFTSLQLDAAHVQPLPFSFEFALSGRAQVAGQKLLASEECGYGGGAIGRAFDNFEISGDHCVMGSAELRFQPDVLTAGSFSSAPYTFVDAGQVWTHGAPAPGQEDTEDGQSVGGGVRFAFGDAFSAYLEYAHPLSREIALEGDDDGRVFVGLTAHH
jgi:hemolysin activation/secretion protein